MHNMSVVNYLRCLRIGGGESDLATFVSEPLYVCSTKSWNTAHGTPYITELYPQERALLLPTGADMIEPASTITIYKASAAVIH